MPTGILCKQDLGKVNDVKNIDDLYKVKGKEDIENTYFNKIFIVEYIGTSHKNKVAFYKCQCQVCKKIFVAGRKHMVGSAYSNGCRDCCRTAFIQNRTKHGFRKDRENQSKTYKAWLNIKNRCFNKNTPDYKFYGAKGITMSEFFREDFMNFYNEVGEAPKDGQNWSIDRIDNTKGYEQGNLRWATNSQQVRNRSRFSNNTSGRTGVSWHQRPNDLYAVAHWSFRDNFGKLKSKCKTFSVKKLGLLEAFAKACAFREEKIKELNSLGYGYTDTHGIEKQ
jgi:hypothetical protein